MSWLRTHRRTATLVGLTLIIPVLFYLWFLLDLIRLGMSYAAERERIEPQISRLAGLLQGADQLSENREQALRRLGQVAFMADEESSELAAGLQSDMRQVLSEAGLSVTNSQVLPPITDDNFERVTLKITVTGSIGGLDAGLVGIAAYRPQVFIESINASPARARKKDDEQVLTAIIQLAVLRSLF